MRAFFYGFSLGGVALLAAIGLLIGLIVGPFVFGIKTGVEMAEDFIEHAPQRRRSKKS